MMPASHGRARSGNASQPKAAVLTPRQLTSYLGKARDLSELLSLQQRHGDRFDGFHLGAFWSRFKNLPRSELGWLRDRLAPVCEQTVVMLPELNARAVANVAHAFAKAGLVGTGPWHNVWTALPGVTRRGLGGFNPQDLSNTAWAFAKAGISALDLFEAISAEALRHGLGGFNPQNLSNTAWAFATAGISAHDLFEAISAEALRQGLGGFNPQNLANTAWAFAVTNPSCADADELFETTSFTTRCAQLQASFSLSSCLLYTSDAADE